MLDALHQRLAGQREASGLFDMRAYARDFAALLRAMHSRHRDGQSPADIGTNGSARNAGAGQDSQA